MNKISGYLNICRKANYLIIGADNLKFYNKKLYLICVNSSYSNNISKIINKLYEQYKIPIIALNEDIENHVGIKNCQIIGIKNKGLSDAMLAQTNEFEFIKEVNRS